MARTLALVPALALAFVAANPAAAAASDAIQAVWSFGGGQVAVETAPDGSLKGTVIRETTLAECPHPVGEVMWENLRLQPDGQYWGGHQWFRNGTCEPIERRGNTAYRVLGRPDGSRFLRVCFSPPENPEQQPKIAPDGSSTDVGRSCVDSDLVSELSEKTPKLQEVAKLPKPGKKGCLSRRSFKIKLKEPRGDALASATVFVNGKRVRVARGKRLTAPVNLKGLPKGRYTVRIIATTVRGKTIKGSRKYRTCTKRVRGKSRSKV